MAGLANSGGGVILIGIRTAKNLTHFGDEIQEIRCFPQPLLNHEQYVDILKAWIYPSVDQVDLNWYQSATDPNLGIVAIIIPPQAQAKKPFLLMRTLDTEGKRVEIVFGFVERRRARVDPLSVQELHTLIRDGLRGDAITRRIEGIEESLARIELQQSDANSRVEAVNFSTLLQERVAIALIDADLSGKRSFALGAIPVESVEISSIFETRDAEVVRLIERPPELRRGGFDLDTGSSARILRGQLRRAVAAGSKVLELWRDGTLIFGATGDEDFLCWGRRPPGMSFLRINPLVLIESTYLFAELSRLVFEKAQPKPKVIQFTVELNNLILDGKPCVLTPGPIGSLGWEFGSDFRQPPQQRASFLVQWNDFPINPGRVSFLLVREIYRWFGIEDENIPYKDGEEFVISPDLIRKAGS